jgi:hypothetical protein
MEVPKVEATEQRYPAAGRRALGTVNGVETEVTSTVFSDKVIITLSQEGRLSHWVFLLHFLRFFSHVFSLWISYFSLTSMAPNRPTDSSPYSTLANKHPHGPPPITISSPRC